MLSIKKHIALLSLFVLLFPSAIQLAHTFENHEHTVCTSTNDQHFHKKELDCSLLHFNFEVFALNFNSDYNLIAVLYFKTLFNDQPQFIPVNHIVKALPRAPPFNLIIT